MVHSTCSWLEPANIAELQRFLCLISTTQHNTTQHNATQHTTTQHSTAQHDTIHNAAT